MKTTKFYQKINKRDKQEMIDFLQNHFRYDTMSSWNNSTSYANKVKVWDVIPGHLQDNAFELLETDMFYELHINWLLEDFDMENAGYSAGFNGRSGGYIVLYHDQYPGRDIDQSATFEDWEMFELRDRVDLVQAFDKMCENVVNQMIHLAEKNKVVEEEYTVVKTRKVIA